MKNIPIISIILAVLLIIFFAPILFTFSKISGNYGDLYLHYYPLKHLITTELIRGKIPLWNPYIFAGQPLLANPQSALFYPLSVIFYFFPVHLSFNYSIVLHFFLAGLFFYILMSHLKFLSSASFLGTAAYVFSSFLVYQVPAGHFIALTGYIWFPLIILFLNKISRTNSKLWQSLFILALAAQFFSGQLFPLYISLVFILLHFISRKFGYWKSLLFSGAGFIIFSAVQFIPSLELSQAAETNNWPLLVKNYSLPLKNLINLVLPNFFGNIIDSTYINLESPSYFIEKNCLYFGIIPFLFSLGGIYYSIVKKKYFYIAVFITGIILALGFYTPVYGILYNFLPGLTFLRSPSRFFYLSLVSLILLAGTGWQAYAGKLNPKIKLAVILIAVINLLYWGNKFIFAQDIAPFAARSSISSYVSPLYRIITEPDKFSANKSMMYRNFNLNGYEAVFLQDFTRYIGLQEKEIFSTTGLARWDLSAPILKGFSSGYLVSSKEITSLEKITELSKDAVLYKLKNPLPRVFIARNYIFFDEGDPYPQIKYLKETPYTPEQELILFKKFEPYPWKSGNGKFYFYSCDTDKIQCGLSADAASIVVFGDIFYPGWKAALGTNKLAVIRGNKVFRVIVVPKGNYTGKDRIFLYYQPLSFFLGLMLTLFAVTAAMAYFVFGVPKKYFGKRSGN